MAGRLGLKTYPYRTETGRQFWHARKVCFLGLEGSKSQHLADYASLSLIVPCVKVKIQEVACVWVVAGPQAKQRRIGVQQPRIDGIERQAAKVPDVVQSKATCEMAPDPLVPRQRIESPRCAQEVDAIVCRQKGYQSKDNIVRQALDPGGYRIYMIRYCGQL